MDRGTLVFGFTAAALLAGVVWLMVLAVQEEGDWEAFKETHHCKVAARISGDVFNTVGFSSSGNMVVGVASTPDKIGWACDDGVTYYR